MDATAIQERLDYLRGEIQSECISYGEIAELQSLAEHIDPSDVVLLQWAGVPEFPDDQSDEMNGAMRVATLDDLRAAVVRMDEAGVQGSTRVTVLIHDVDFAQSEGDDEYRQSYCAAIDAAGALTDEKVIMIWPSNPADRS